MAPCVVQGQFINDRQVLLKAAEKAGVTGAQDLLDDEEQLKSEVRSHALHPLQTSERPDNYHICLCSRRLEPY